MSNSTKYHYTIDDFTFEIVDPVLSIEDEICEFLWNKQAKPAPITFEDWLRRNAFIWQHSYDIPLRSDTADHQFEDLIKADLVKIVDAKTFEEQKNALHSYKVIESATANTNQPVTIYTYESTAHLHFYKATSPDELMHELYEEHLPHCVTPSSCSDWVDEHSQMIKEKYGITIRTDTYKHHVNDLIKNNLLIKL